MIDKSVHLCRQHDLEIDFIVGEFSVGIKYNIYFEDGILMFLTNSDSAFLLWYETELC